MATQRSPAGQYDLEPYRAYLRLLASQQLGPRYRGKVDLSGIIQETLWEAHVELAKGQIVGPAGLLAWLRRILANNIADEARRFLAAKRDVGREVQIQQALDASSQKFEQWAARDYQPGAAAEQEDLLLALAGALERLPDAQREALLLHYCSGATLVEIASRLGRTRDAVAGLIRRGLRRLRTELAAPDRCPHPHSDEGSAARPDPSLTPEASCGRRPLEELP
ncbi:MAG: sigma-70 family RNA polymerase sigma factor [Pirellulales bacterium]|nr:sigma-70 family RNA polymerase sigma factor [Pirellulales bacterium]